MKKINKIILGVVPFASALAVLPIAAACNSSRRYDQTEQSKLRIASGFSTSNSQGQALQGIVDTYNEWVKKNNKTAEGHKEVEVVVLPNGYNTDVLSSKLQAQDTEKFWNLVVNYPSAASLIAKYEMNLAVPEEDYNSFGISKAFKDVNKLIAGNFQNEKWVVPLSCSSEMAAIAKPLLGKLLSELTTEMGVTIDANNSKQIKAYMEYFKKADAKQKDYINGLWNGGKVKAENKDKVKEEILKLTPTISDSMFENYEDLINLAISLKKLYPSSVTNYVLGFDSLPTAINIMASSLANGDLKENYINPDPSVTITGGWDFSSFIKEGTKQYNLFKKISDLLIRGIDEGAIWVGGGGRYGSSALVNYQLAISIGSTAGYFHTYIRNSNDRKRYFVKGTKITLEDNSLELVAENDKDKNADTTAFWFKALNNSNVNSVKLSTLEKVGSRFDKQLKDAAADEKAKQIKGKDGWLVSGPAWSFKSNKVVFKYADENKQEKTIEFEGMNLGDLFKDNNSDDKNVYFLEKGAIDVKSVDKSTVVGKNDAAWISAPEIFDKNSKKHGIFSQGPSLVGIHANEKEDNATRLFIKWLFTKYEDEISLKTVIGRKETIDKYTNVSPLDAFNFTANYVSPTEEYFTKDINSEEIKKLNPANKLAFENFKKTDSDPSKYIAVEDVAAAESDALRRAITTAAGGLVTAAQSSKEITFKTFLDGILKSFKI
ncbi:hypothetical protein DA803_00375 [[Mycoplasma] phocae]|uniref:Lipoprotein n=1 Tax=[Mycoplasma] phocae TaxID=142651 RepID=A0A2Z5IQT1_9BACT|nr:P80 family lipoprotein [[Mycoplasma] phocae]AXE60556.1 hypothetical protein DA803_00375 [[Mycoplasma] phocae]